MILNMGTKRIILFLLLVLITALSANADITRLELDNGLRVIIDEDHSVPLASVRVYVNTGSINEGEYLGCGISHFIEHMMFSATDEWDKEYIENRLEELGAVGNAATWKDYTTYYHTVPSHNISELLKMYAKLLFKAKFTEDEYESQRGIILSEMEMVGDSPHRILQEEFYRLAYLKHPVRYPVIGYEDKFLSVTIDDLERYYHRFYVPNNMVMAVVGDFDTDYIAGLIEREFSEYPLSNIDIPPMPDEPTVVSERLRVVEREYGLTYLRLGFRTTNLYDYDTPALDLLSAVLSSGRDAILPRRIKNKLGLVSDIEAWNYTPAFIEGNFQITASMPYENLDRVREEILNVLDEIAEKGVSNSDLRRAKAQIKAELYLGDEEFNIRAGQLAINEMYYGDPEYDLKYIDIINSLTSNDIKRVTKEYIIDGEIMEVRIIPPAKSEKSTEIRVVDEKPLTLTTLDNGLKVMVLERHNNPSISVSLNASAGSVSDPKGKEGLSNLTARMLLLGAGGMSSSDIMNKIESAGGSLNYEAGSDNTGLRLDVISDGFETAIGLLATVVQKPNLRSEDLPMQKEIAVQMLKSNLDDWSYYAYIKVREMLYDAHPYSHIPAGTEEGINSITIDDVREFYNRHFTPDNMVLTVVGDIDTDRALKLIEKHFGGWKKSSLSEKADIPDADTFYETGIVEEERWSYNQTALYYIFPGLKRASDDEYALMVLDSIISGIIMPSGRLHTRLRGEGLVYVVHAYNVPYRYGGHIVIYLGTSDEKLARAKQIVEEEIERIKTEIVPESELRLAKEKLLSAESIYRRQGFSDIASQITMEELFGGGYERYFELEKRIDEITAWDVLDVAKRYLDDYIIYIAHPEVSD